MSPDTIRELRDFLTAVSRLLSEGPHAHPSWLKTCEDLLAALPPDPGGAMPEPMPGMVAVEPDGDAWIVQARSRWSIGWMVFDARDRRFHWTPDNIREIRTPDGRVLWRAGE